MEQIGRVGLEQLALGRVWRREGEGEGEVGLEISTQGFSWP